ncbi:MAG: hypothetical protein WDO19_23385 [Bacteroidota bacterium]
MPLRLFSFCSCSRNAVNLDYTNAKGEVAQLGNLTFRFSKSLISDSLLNTWDSTEYIRLNQRFPAGSVGKARINWCFLHHNH